MGGSGGSDYRDSLGGIGDIGGAPSCAALAFEAAVASPDPDVALQLEVGAVCEILLQGTPRQLAVYVRDTGALLGGITERWSDLTRCIDAGYSYEAEVISLNPVRLQIRPRPFYLLDLPFSAILVDFRPDLIAEGDVIELALGPDGHAIAVTFDQHRIGSIPAEPVALPDSIRRERTRAASVDSIADDGATAAITVVEA